jgi:hypothetical protein
VDAANPIPQLEVGLPVDIDPSTLNWKQEKKLRQVPLFSGKTLQYQRIPMCGHKFRPSMEPRHRNCESCWFTFFNVHGELTKAVDEVFTQFGESGLMQLRGPKFTRNFTKFMSTIASWKKAADAAKEQNEQQDSTSTASGSGPVAAIPEGAGSEAVEDIGL